jgi:TM2 domain-containing membrane protein YozV
MTADHMKKSVGPALLINFFFPGGGHLYASGGRKGGGMLLMSILCALTSMLIIPAFIFLLIWIYALATSSDVVQEYNNALEAESRTLEERKVSKERAERLAEEAKAAENASFLSGSKLAQGFMKISALLSAQVLSEEEARALKRKLMMESSACWTDEEPADFLAPFASLLSDGVLTRDELEGVKKLYVGILRQRSA